GHPGAAERVHLFRLVAGELGALADPHDLAVGDPDRAILDHAEAVAFERCYVAVDEQPVPHAFALRRPRLLRSKQWRAGPTSASFWSRRPRGRRSAWSARRSPPARSLRGHATRRRNCFGEPSSASAATTSRPAASS